jgi:hypothetical protein
MLSTKQLLLEMMVLTVTSLTSNAQPHTYLVNTSQHLFRAAPLVSTISVEVNTENKADQFIQPYIVQEFLIKY